MLGVFNKAEFHQFGFSKLRYAHIFFLENGSSAVSCCDALNQYIVMKTMFISSSYLLSAASYLAPILVFAAFFMKAIIPLRVIAITSNLAFIFYALGIGSIPILVLHLSLLPLNVIRIVQHIRLVRDVRNVVEGDPNIEKLLPFMEKRTLEKDAVIFRKGDRAEALYFLSQGRVLLKEIGVTIEPGAIFGEIALFLEDRGRTASAVCLSACELYSLSLDKVEELVVLDPSFGLFLTKLIVVRMKENVDALPS